jgi:hypothetical protein
MTFAALLFVENDKTFNYILSKTPKVRFQVTFTIVLK